MAILPITKDHIELYDLVAHPKRIYASSSSGLTGSINLFSDGTQVLKDVIQQKDNDDKPADDDNIESLRSSIINNAAGGTTNLGASLQIYLDKVNSIPAATRLDKRMEVIRFAPGFKFDPNFLRKRVVKETYFPFYRQMYSAAQWNYTNYHTLNFCTSSYLSKDSVIIYPAASSSAVAAGNYNPYAPSGSFTFNFFINPRYTTENVDDAFSAGTILHMSSCYAITLVTGTSKGLDDKPDGYRLLLQLSQSADIPPRDLTISGDTVTDGVSSRDTGFAFISADNSLKRNNWHHVAVRWGGASVNDGSGSFIIDDQAKNHFVITSASCMQGFSDTIGDPDAIFVGNYYEGSNAGSDQIVYFFNSTAASEEGVVKLSNETFDPTVFTFRHPLNAEIHDLKIYDVYQTDEQIATSSLQGPSFDVTKVGPDFSGQLLFYVPPFFIKNSSTRNILQTPFQAKAGKSNDPFNVALSFGVQGFELNLENFTREFIRGQQPRLLMLTSSIIETSTNVASANNFLDRSSSHRKRNITVLPNDNGRFTPNFQLLLTGAAVVTNQLTSGSSVDKFQSDFGQLDLTKITLQNLVSTSNFFFFQDPPKGSLQEYDVGSIYYGTLIGANPEDPSVAPGSTLAVLQATGDPSSNEVVFFDVSNIFYGDRIKPGSVVLKDLAVTGTGGRISITLKDDGYGSLFRADCLTTQAHWANVGTVLYDEGIVVVKTPNLPLFGKDTFELSFEGERSIYVYEVTIPAPKGMINSSSNPHFQKLVPTDYPNEVAKEFVYVTGIQLHDDNLNVIARANLAQPVIKRDGDRIAFKLRMDY